MVAEVEGGWREGGMACEGRARNRMLRKRWIVRNPVVGEDDITQLVLAPLFNTSWPRGLFFLFLCYYIIFHRHFFKYIYKVGGLFYCLCHLKLQGFK